MNAKARSVYRVLVIAYVLAVVALGFLAGPVYLVLLTPVAFARPILRELKAVRDLDEREMSITYRSSHIAFYVFLMVLATTILKKGIVDKARPSPELLLLLVIPILVKLVTSTALNYSLRKAGLGIAWCFGGFWILFALASHGLTAPGLIECLLGLSAIIAALISLRWRHVGGALLIFEGGAGATMTLSTNWDPAIKLLTVSLLTLPLVLAGVFVFASRDDTESEVAQNGTAE